MAGEGEVALAARLGSAEEFAQELRNSAGLPPRAVADPPSRLDTVRAWIGRAAGGGESVRAQLDARLLWLVARGWLLAVAVAVVISHFRGTYAWGHAHAWLPHSGARGESAAVVLLALVALSLLLGRRGAGRSTVALDRAASALALVAIIPAAWHMDSPPRSLS